VFDPDLVRREISTEEEAQAADRGDHGPHTIRPSAVFAAHNRLTIGAVTGLRALGLERRSVVGFERF